MSTSTDVQTLIETFAAQITAVIQRATDDRVRAVVAGAFGAPIHRGPGRPRRAAAQPTRPAPKARKRASAKVTRARRLQGRYLGLLKGLNGEARNRVKAAAKDKGVAAALSLGQSLQRKKST